MQRGASDEDIKRAFRKKAKESHPDLHPGDKQAEAAFKEVNEAYEVLSDDQKRARYDQFGHEEPGQGFGGGGFEGFSGFDDILSSIFGGFGGGAGGARRAGPQRGADLQYNLTISFEEAAFGCNKEISVARDEACDECGGSGAKKGTSATTCTTCKGTGQVRVTMNSAFGRIQNVRTCDACKGTGKIIREACAKCNGRGKLRKPRKISFSIPAGIDNGQAVSLHGQGEAGEQGGGPGDLYIHITVKPHALFRRQDFDLYCDVPVSYAQAALGGEVDVPTLQGMIKYNMPEGTQPGAVLRLKGYGIANLRGSGKGDLFIKVLVEVPRRLGERQKELLRQYEASLTEKEYEGKKSFFDRVKQVLGGQ